jgi:hypothetical protein
MIHLFRLKLRNRKQIFFELLRESKQEKREKFGTWFVQSASTVDPSEFFLGKPVLFGFLIKSELLLLADQVLESLVLSMLIDEKEAYQGKKEQ